MLSKTENQLNVLTQVAERIEGISNVTEQNNVAATTAILAGLVLDRIIVKQILKEEIMRESVIYQDIQAEEAAKVVCRLLNRKIGQVSQKLTTKIRELPVEQIENLGEALLDFQSEQDLQQWLSTQES